eukprot:TRINITY_DN31338_c0_g1_i1.p1 TRINITY_DN31338_c0_g1~~TRINITY_DN31338_c0_g1_i1.p1  ORF type:complete len:190 (-),score=70.71 TRINITY_DN31338_c0_g1_i1:72-641(-)
MPRMLLQVMFFFFQAEDGIRDAQESRGLGDVYKRQVEDQKKTLEDQLASSRRELANTKAELRDAEEKAKKFEVVDEMRWYSDQAHTEEKMGEANELAKQNAELTARLDTANAKSARLEVTHTQMVGEVTRLRLAATQSKNELARVRAEQCARGDLESCLLYTSDAADEEDSVDLGGRRIVKKKKHEYNG